MFRVFFRREMLIIYGDGVETYVSLYGRAEKLGSNWHLWGSLTCFSYCLFHCRRMHCSVQGSLFVNTRTSKVGLNVAKKLKVVGSRWLI